MLELAITSGKIASGNATIFYKAFKLSIFANKLLPTIFLVMGTGGDHSAWKPQIDFFTSKGFQVVAFDNSGTGRTECKDLKLSIEQMADDIESVRKHLKIDTFHGIGISLGSVILQHYGAKYPTHVSSLQFHVTLMRASEELSDRINNIKDYVITKCYEGDAATNQKWGRYNRLLAPFYQNVIKIVIHISSTNYPARVS